MTPPLTVNAQAAHITKTWHHALKLETLTLPATEKLTAVIARPQGIFHQAQWTLTITSQSQTIHPIHGTPYLLPALTWTESGTVTGQA